MTKKSKAKTLSHKIIRQQFSGDNKYPGFQARMMATLIDLTLVALLFTPIFMLVGNILFGDNSPAEMISQASNEIVEIYEDKGTKIDFLTYVKQNPKYYNYFYKEYGFMKMVIYQFLQFFTFITLILVFWFKKQTTPGKMCLSMKIVDATSMQKPTHKQLIIRLLSYAISAIPLFLGVIWMIFNKKKQTWHDKISNTLVIKT